MRCSFSEIHRLLELRRAGPGEREKRADSVAVFAVYNRSSKLFYGGAKPRYDVFDWLDCISEKNDTSLCTDFLYTGHYWHGQSGLFLTLYRAYDPETGRWISRDPLGEDGGMNLYAYVSNGPIVYIDRFGLFGDGFRKEYQEYPYLKHYLYPSGFGHSDFTGGDEFDYTAEDHGWTTPYIRPKNHFRPLEESIRDVNKAISDGDRDAFQRAMHRGQDYFSHYKKGYRWKPFGWTKCKGLGHMTHGTKPDEDLQAWLEAEQWTIMYYNTWKAVWGNKR